MSFVMCSVVVRSGMVERVRFEWMAMIWSSWVLRVAMV